MLDVRTEKREKELQKQCKVRGMLAGWQGREANDFSLWINLPVHVNIECLNMKIYLL